MSDKPQTADSASNLIETDYVIGQDNIEGTIGPVEFDVHRIVFPISAAAVIGFVIFTLLLPAAADALFGALFDIVTRGFDWFFLAAGNVFVLFCLALVFTPWGSVRLGGPDARPDYSYAGWFAMLFAAGMGIGLVFYGVAEPMEHFNDALLGPHVGPDGLRTDTAPLNGAAGDELAAARLGMAATIFHWGLHPWAIYAVVALALALFTYNKGLPLTIRSAFHPLLGERVWGWPGHVIDITAVFATLFGLATSLGFGATQATSGLGDLFGLPGGNLAMIVLICVITAIAIISVLRGLDGGVKVLSEINMALALLLLAFVLFAGPTLQLLSYFGTALMDYVRTFPALTNPIGREDSGFVQNWTSFYWAWWISWSPFVGMFIARVSRGRTVREFVICVLLIPSMVCVLWMVTFGGTAIGQILNDGYVGAQEAALELKLFRMLGELPLSGITSLIGITLVLCFFITSADSGSLVIDTITAGGKVDAPVSQRVFWCVFEGLVAIVLLMSAGGLQSLQSMVISTGLPFTIVLLLMCWAIWRGLRSEKR